MAQANKIRPSVLAIVPAFNESRHIGSVIADLRQHQPNIHIVVVNDCSTDDTKKIVQELGEPVLDLPINLGIGGAVQTGLKYAFEMGYEVAVQFDGDGQHLAEEMETILAPVLSGEADVVIGSRFLGDRSYRSGNLRRIGMRIFQFVNSLLIGQRMTDNTSGFRAFNRPAIAFLARFYPQDYPEPEAVIELYRNGFRLMELPVRMRQREGGDSSIRALRSAYYMVKVLMAIGIAFSRRPVRKESS